MSLLTTDLQTANCRSQEFFNEDMGVPMRMIPDYDTFECRFEFGTSPDPQDEADARATPCFRSCTSIATTKRRGVARVESESPTAKEGPPVPVQAETGPQCPSLAAGDIRMGVD